MPLKMRRRNTEKWNVENKLLLTYMKMRIYVQMTMKLLRADETQQELNMIFFYSSL